MTFKPFPLHIADSYKLGHMTQYPEGTEQVYFNFTPRSFTYLPIPPAYDEKKAVVFGFQGTTKELHEYFQEEFFSKPKNLVINRFARRILPFVGANGPDDSVKKASDLYDLGYLPLRVKTIKEGKKVKAKIPMMTIRATHKDFAWLAGYLETWISTETWKAATVATVANAYRRILKDFATKTGSAQTFVDWQAHDFSMRGLSGIHDCAKTGSAHLTSSLGTDNLLACDYLEEYYFAGRNSNGFIGGSVPATEHSVMCMGSKEGEFSTYKRLMTTVYPSGIVSIVSDTWDYWDVITKTLPALKQEILSRKPDSLGFAKVVIRPDSGDPVDIVCGTARPVNSLDVGLNFKGRYVIFEGRYYERHDGDEPGFIEVEPTPEMKGSIQCLWDTFQGTITDKGYKVLNPRIGLIYGDSITLYRAYEILMRLEEKGFASSNVVLGVGSFTYQYLTRDSMGIALKATHGIINGEAIGIYKEPKTDSGTKKSAKGLLRVELENGEYVLHDSQTEEQESQGELKTLYEDGNFFNETTLDEIRVELF
jgi:nicotinamide phosphoribosyltransferase